MAPLESLIEYACSIMIGCFAVVTLAFKLLCGECDVWCLSVAHSLYNILWTICIVYFVGHLTYTHARHRNRLLFKLHHFVAIVGCMFVYFFPMFDMYLVMMACMEVSSAKLHAMHVDAFKWILSERDLLFMFIFTWMLFRCFLSPWLLVFACRLAINQPDAPNVIHVVFHVFFLACNMYWTYRFYKRWFSSTVAEEEQAV